MSMSEISFILGVVVSAPFWCVVGVAIASRYLRSIATQEAIRIWKELSDD